MPRYYATGVTCKLAVCELNDGVSNIIDFQCHTEQHNDAKRMNDALDRATPLWETMVKGEGEDASTVHFLGLAGDMPMTMSVASFRGRDGTEGDDDGEAMNDRIGKAVADALPSSSIGSPLTSLGSTPTATQLTFNSSQLKPVQGTEQSVDKITIPKAIVHSIEQHHQINGPQSLVLNITLSTASFLPVEAGGIRKKLYDNKDVKVEIFMNGELVEVDFVSGRRVTRKAPSLSLRYMGKRIHRQVEKPWAYVPSQINAGFVQDAAERWNGVSEALLEESELRGRDQYGDVPPSAEYLMALSQVALPDRVKHSRGLGIIDVVITAGRGQKYGSEVEYLTGPTRLDDKAYTLSNPLVDPTILLDPMLHLPSSDMTSSPEIPLAQVRTRAAPFEFTTPLARSQKTADELKDSLGLSVNLQKTRLDGFENARGEGNGKGRSLAERLGDIKKMSPSKQQEEISKLRDEFGASDKVKEPPKKKLKINTLPSLAPEVTMSPADMFKPSTPTHLLAQTLSEATIINDQPEQPTMFGRRIDEPVQSFSTPQKRTKASALANSPARVPVKIPKTYGKAKDKQSKDLKVGEWDDAPIPFSLDGPTPSFQTVLKADGALAKAGATLSDGTPSRGANRSSKAWIPGEQTAAEALAEFKVPALSAGSCVTYAPDLGVAGGGGAAVGGKVRRQVMKSRKGEFREEQIVVGMRFCVV